LVVGLGEVVRRQPEDPVARVLQLGVVIAEERLPERRRPGPDLLALRVPLRRPVGLVPLQPRRDHRPDERHRDRRPDESVLAGHARPGPLAGLRPGIVLLGIVLLGVGLLAVGLRSPSVVLLGVGLPGLGVGLLAVGLRSPGVVLLGVGLPGLGFGLGGLGRVEVVLVGGLRVRFGLFRLDGLGG